MIEIKNFSFTYNNTGKKALDKVELNIKRGEFSFLTGASRAGKSTLCLALAGFIPRSIKGKVEGGIYLDGEDILTKSVTALSDTIGIVFQDYESQIFSTRVDLEVAFGLENRGLRRGVMQEKVEEVLKSTGLYELKMRNPATLSGGQKQRLAIASILAAEPDLIALDEPLTDLDPEGREDILNILALMKENGATVLFVEHDIEHAGLFDKCIVLKNGSLFLNDSPSDVFRDSEVLSSTGVMPHPFSELFEKLSLNERPLIISDAERILREKSIQIKNRDFYDEDKILSGEDIIEIKNLTHLYPGGVEALKGINLKIRRGDFLALVGRNGSGKTTLAKHINRLLEPTSGRINLMGDDVMKLKRSEIGKRIGYVFQNPDHQIFSETVYDEVAFAPENFKLPEEEVKRRVKEAIRIVGLEGYETSDPFMLTRGEREKVAVASVLSVTPEVIILDEPTTGLDYIEVKDTMEMLKELNLKGCTIIMITHDMDIVAGYAKRVVAMENGEILFYGDVRDFFAQDEVLRKTGIKPPLITQLSRRFGFTALNVDEFLRFVDV